MRERLRGHRNSLSVRGACCIVAGIARIGVGLHRTEVSLIQI